MAYFPRELLLVPLPEHAQAYHCGKEPFG